jgi:hypothetical protein
MEQTDSIVLLFNLVTVLALLTLFRRSMREALVEAIKTSSTTFETALERRRPDEVPSELAILIENERRVMRCPERNKGSI